MKPRSDTYISRELQSSTADKKQLRISISVSSDTADTKKAGRAGKEIILNHKTEVRRKKEKSKFFLPSVISNHVSF